MAKKGRPPKKDRPRYPSGQVKPEGAGITGTQLHRLRSLGKYPVLETQVGRLLFLGEIDEVQARTAWRIAEIYGRYDRAMGRRRAAASPAYEVGRGRDMGHESEEEAERSAAAVKRFTRLQEAIRAVSPTPYPALVFRPFSIRGTIESLCVDDEVLPLAALLEVKMALDRLAEPLGLRGRRRNIS